MDLQKINTVDWDQVAGGYVFVAAAGFEARALRGAQVLVDAGVPLVSCVLLEFRERVIPRNEENHRILASVLRQSVAEGTILHRQIETVESIWEDIPKISEVRTIIDISGMPHSIILRALRSAANAAIQPLVLYTEAESYYPSYPEAELYLKYDDDELAFFYASKEEETEVMYSGLSKVGTVKGFEGWLIPTEPTAVVLFPTFKRTRTSAILSELEVQRKVFLIGKPVRSDLKWRMRALRVINYDLIDYDTDYIREISTLSPMETLGSLESLFKEGVISPRHNILISPHGSKMQTVGVWKFCELNPDIRVITSYPHEYFPDKYSVGYRDGFILDTRSLDR